MSETWINNIQRFAIHDGPGIRTAVFFQGCNLRCGWCHNPDAIPLIPVFKYFRGKCLGCGLCAAACVSGALGWNGSRPVWRGDNCTLCAKCEAACPAGACGIFSRNMSVDEVIGEVLKDEEFYRASGGGLTCSGGEAMLRTVFLKELFIQAKALGIHTAVETAAAVSWESFEAILSVTDLFLVDLKLLDNEAHKLATGIDNKLILDNLRKLAFCPVAVMVRVPVVPGVNADARNIKQMAAFLSGIGFTGRVELLKFHTLGAVKYEAIGAPNLFAEAQPPSGTDMLKFVSIMRGYGLDAFTE